MKTAAAVDRTGREGMTAGAQQRSRKFVGQAAGLRQAGRVQAEQGLLVAQGATWGHVLQAEAAKALG